MKSFVPLPLILNLNRQQRYFSHSFAFEELNPAMDPQNKTPSYRLGRLFAVLEKADQEALGGRAHTTQRHLGGAMVTPGLVFGRLLKADWHHLAKLNPGRAVQLRQLVDEILAPLPVPLPSVFSQGEQAVFIVGYHHQRAELWKKRPVEVEA